MDCEDSFQAGDMVRLKSGGPPMLVRSVSRDTAYCQWYAGVDVHQGTFLFSSLRGVNAESRQGRPAPLRGQPGQIKESPVRDH